MAFWESELWRIKEKRAYAWNDQPIIFYRRIGPSGGVALLAVSDFSRRWGPDPTCEVCFGTGLTHCGMHTCRKDEGYSCGEPCDCVVAK